MLVAGGALGTVYAALFEKSFRASSIGLGLAVGAVHGVVTGIALAFVPDVHPLVPVLLPAPGPFFLGAGAFGVVLFLGLHLIFGAVIAAWYGPVLEPRRQPLQPRRRLSTH
jgi:hypothetical protein